LGVKSARSFVAVGADLIQNATGNAMTTITVFGGTGFLGRRLVQRIAAEGASVRVAVRHSDPARSALRTTGLNQITLFSADVRDPTSVAAAVAGADSVVNAVSAYVEKSGVTFEAVHERGAETVAREAASAGVARLVLVSGIGADPKSGSPYIRARGRGELVVQHAFPDATIVRPCAMFGPGDALFATLADLARLLPALPLIGGDTRLQPVYVEDVAEAVARILADRGTAGRTYELAGPGVYRMRELVEFTLRLIGTWRLLVPVPLVVATILARLFEFLPSPPLTTGQVDLLRADNVVSGVLPGFQELGIEPKGVEEVVPTYIGTSHMLEPH
jgi:NADH dehydrogenase